MIHPFNAPVGGADKEGGIYVLGQLSQILQLPLGIGQSCVQPLILTLRLAVGIAQAFHATIERDAQPQQGNSQSDRRPQQAALDTHGQNHRKSHDTYDV